MISTLCGLKTIPKQYMGKKIELKKTRTIKTN